MRQWTTVTPDARRVVVSRTDDAWTVACGDSTFGSRERLDVALIEAILMDSDFVLHSMRFDYADWCCRLADKIERGALPADDERA